MPDQTPSMPPLPSPMAHVHSDGEFHWDRNPGTVWWPVALYTEEQVLDAANERAQAVAPAWISVADRLPEAKTEVLIAFAEQSIPSTGQYTGSPHDQDGWCYPTENRWSGPDGADPTITHWMPLPPVPTLSLETQQNDQTQKVQR